MGDIAKIKIAQWAAVFGMAAGLFSMIGAWYILPYRIDALEKSTEVLKARAQVDHDAITRIDANVQLLLKKP